MYLLSKILKSGQGQHSVYSVVDPYNISTREKCERGLTPYLSNMQQRRHYLRCYLLAEKDGLEVHHGQY
jgi:hypothetical protein